MLTATPKPVSGNGFEVSMPSYTLISFLTDWKGTLRSLYAMDSWGTNSFINQEEYRRKRTVSDEILGISFQVML